MTAALPLRAWCEQAEVAAASTDDGDAAGALVNDAACTALRAQLGAPHAIARDALVAAIADSRDPLDAAIEAVPVGRTWELSGAARHVIGARDANLLLVVARSRSFAGRERGLRVYRVDARGRGVAVIPHDALGTDAARVDLHAVPVTDSAAVGPPRDATDAVLTALDVATLVAVAEMLGAASAAQAAAMAWVSTREQFGAPLAAKQAVQHRVADMFMACRSVRLLLDDAIARYEAGHSIAVEAAHTKLVASEQLPTVTAGAHQLHGGEGYYADQPLHRWHRCVVALAAQLGNAAVQRTRLGRRLARGAGLS